MDVSPQIQCYGESGLADIELGKKMLDSLEHYYPRHAWFVNVNHEAGVLTIQLLYQEKNGIVKKWAHGMLSHITSLTSDPEIKRRAMRHGGELLERYGLARAGGNPYTYIDACNNSLDTTGIV